MRQTLIPLLRKPDGRDDEVNGFDATAATFAERRTTVRRRRTRNANQRPEFSREPNASGLAVHAVTNLRTEPLSIAGSISGIGFQRVVVQMTPWKPIPRILESNHSIPRRSKSERARRIRKGTAISNVSAEYASRKRKNPSLSKDFFHRSGADAVERVGFDAEETQQR